MLSIFKITLTIAGLLLLVVAAAPLVQFYENMNNINIYYNITNNSVIITLHYGATPGLTDYRFAVLSNGRVLNQTSGASLSPDTNITLTVPLNAIPANSTLEYELEGKIAGLYYIRFYVHGGGG